MSNFASWRDRILALSLAANVGLIAYIMLAEIPPDYVKGIDKTWEVKLVSLDDEDKAEHILEGDMFTIRKDGNSFFITPHDALVGRWGFSEGEERSLDKVGSTLCLNVTLAHKSDNSNEQHWFTFRLADLAGKPNPKKLESNISRRKDDQRSCDTMDTHDGFAHAEN